MSLLDSEADPDRASLFGHADYTCDPRSRCWHCRLIRYAEVCAFHSLIARALCQIDYPVN